MAKKKKHKKAKKRDFNLLLIAKREINCRPKVIKSKKVYNRKNLKKVKDESNY